MKQTENLYTHYQAQVKNKDTAVQGYIERALLNTAAAFRWNGLPETIPPVELERMLQEGGHCFITDVDGKLYALSGALGGLPDPYYRPTVYTVANPALKLNKEYNIKDDGVLVKNNTESSSILPIIGKYAVLMTDAVISLNTASILTRITMLISASDDRTKQSADEFLNKILNGDFSVIGENAFFKGVNMQTAPTANSSYINQLIELVQYYKASLYNELGLNANYNMKRERLNLGEVSMNIDVLLPMIDNMLMCRQKAAEMINERFGTEITVELGSSWKYERENYEALLQDAEQLSEEATETAVETPETAETIESTETDETPRNDPETDEKDETDKKDTDDEV